MKRVFTPVAAHRRWLSKCVIDTVSWLSQSADIFTKFNDVNLQLQGNGVNLIKAKSAIFTFLSKFDAVQTKSKPIMNSNSFQIINSNSFQLLNELIY